MKKLLLLGCLLTAATAQAQHIRFGAKAGAGLATLSNLNVSGKKLLLGANGGVMAEAPLGELLAFHPELLFSQKGIKTEGSGPGGYSQTITTRSSYLDLPLLLRAHANSFFFELGPQVGYLLALKTTNTYGSSTVPTTTTTSTSTDGARRVDLGYVLGAGYQLPKGLEVGLRYNGGLLDVHSPSGPASTYNSVFQLQVGYLLGGE